jgi:F0F1-type ATP synthase membrane subunit b/b'
MTDAGTTLDEIRATERDMARRLQGAKDKAAADLEAGRTEAKRLAAGARSRGKEAADVRYDEVVRTARHQAAGLEADAAEQAAALREHALPHLRELVDAIVELVLAPPTERGK